MSQNSTEDKVAPQAGQLFQFNTDLSVSAWGILVDKQATKQGAFVKWLRKDGDPEFLLAIEEAKLTEFENVHYRLRQEYRNVIGFIFLHESVRLWVPVDFWDNLEECDT